MGESEKRQKVVRQAVGWLGAGEGSAEHQTIIDIYNSIQPLPGGYRMSYTDPWCAAFVSAVGERAGLGKIILPECSCDRMIAKYKAAGRWVEDDEYIPSPGDIIMYDWDDTGAGDCTGSADHVGIVEMFFEMDRSITVIEGNKSDSVGRRVISAGAANIRGYCVPDYGAETVSAPPLKDSGNHSQAVKTPSYFYNVRLPLLKMGMVDGAVEALQELLAAAGYYEGAVDGHFGSGTAGAVVDFQNAHGLEADGEVGGQVWNKIINDD